MHSRHRDGFELEPHARAFDARAGLPSEAVPAIAQAVRTLCPERLLEVGAGTGEIGAHLAALYAPTQYIALDRSPAMLARFRERADDAIPLLVADANAAWPVRDRCFAGVFMARVAHLLEPAVLAAELVRVLRPGGLVVIGRRLRAPGNVRSALRRELLNLLSAHGYTPRRGGREALTLSQLGVGLRARERVHVSAWTVLESAAEALAAWRAKPGLSGIDVSQAHRRSMLATLEDHARARFGEDLATPHAGREEFVLDVLESPAQ